MDEETLAKFSKATGMPLRFIKNFKHREGRIINNLNEGSSNANVGSVVEIGQQYVNQNDLSAILNLGREKEVLLIKGHIAQLQHNVLVAKMNKLPDSEILEMQQQIAEKEKEIVKIESKIK